VAIVDIKTRGKVERPDVLDWTDHWSDDNQSTIAQRFFSLYRQMIFSRTVRHFIDKYFPSTGLFLEAGSGTSETSMRINKHNGARKLIALDIILPVVERCHLIMDVRICGDIFQLPFSTNSIDGIWNVGVMEHFTPAQIDVILSEFHRVLRSDGRLILLWPGVDSIPQRLLRTVEKAVHSQWHNYGFHFHPAEISQLKSVAEGRQILSRNGFEILEIETGLRSLFAFKILVGQKP
jgi:SAM-dependent methyltransferase